jgi:hypothetical protein
MITNPDFSTGLNKSQLGFSLSSLLSDAKAAVATQVKAVETKVSTQAKEVLGDKIYTQASALVKKEGEKLTAAAKDFASGKVNEYLAKPENQKAILDGGVDALAAKTKAYLWSLTESYKVNGLLGIRKTHPILFYSVAAVTSLTVAAIAIRVGRVVVGKKQKVPVKKNPCHFKKKIAKKANPSTKKKTSSRRSLSRREKKT